MEGFSEGIELGCPDTDGDSEGMELGWEEGIEDGCPDTEGFSEG